jgi:DNA-binding NtrC family response regulator
LTNGETLMTTASPHGSVLVVDDDADLRAILAESLEQSGFSAAQAVDSADARSRLDGFAYDALVVDLSLPDGDGMQVLEYALDRYPSIRAIVITGFGGVEEAVQAIRLGAVDFLIKPFQLSQVARTLGSALEQQQLKRQNAELREQLRERFRFDSIIGCHSSMREVFARLELIAPMNTSVLIQGETGTGKELIARTIHQNSPRAEHRFVAFNAAAIPEGLVEAELFGHVKGAFTGAIASRVGRFEMAQHGTLFIDEVSSMPLALQAKLLRVLQERELERVGESRSVPIDIRIIAASNTDLKKMVKAGQFREDLYYRLNVIPVTLPPLRHRREDVPLLAQHFVRKSCESNGLTVKLIAQDALRDLMDYDWPGNIRQLENAIEHAVAMSAKQAEIRRDALPMEIRGEREPVSMSGIPIPDEGVDFTSVVSQLERDLILRCLERTNGNKRQAARLLQLSRTTFIDKMQRLNIGAPRSSVA